MDIKRRQLLKVSALSGAAIASGLAPELSSAESDQASTVEPLRILVLGGTGFIGPHMVSEALRRGHDVTLFNRGRTNNELFPDLVTLNGDRDNGLDSLKGKKWDVVIDNSGYVPRHVADSARLLASSASHYVYVSTISVYASLANPVDEDAPLAWIDDESVEEVTNATYGPLKALCEKRAAREFGEDRLAILRPTYICGPGDRTDRYTYWPARTLQGGEMIWPGTPADKIQIIDVRDLANFTIDVCENRTVGTFNTVTPAGSFDMGDLLGDSLAVTAAETTPVWVDYDFIQSQDTGEGNSFPIWSPPLQEYAGSAYVNGERAVAQGLRNRPTRETARDTVSWWKTLPAERTEKTRAGLSPEIEARLIEAWKTRKT
ncbi:MAG: NAD-dependent epimerase/dehydratase family protein [Gammaproteobacteria bacterium]|nr:NAD-dependent epimerase/dehydratase family protein [Gammaproteobacteria bacterium]